MSEKKFEKKFEKKPANRSAGQSVKSGAKAAARTGAGASAKVTAVAKAVKNANDSGKPDAKVTAKTPVRTSAKTSAKPSSRAKGRKDAAKNEALPPQCPNFKKCGGCRLQNMTYEKQLSHKQVRIIRLLGRYHHVGEIIGMDDPFHYRNKVQAAFGERGGQIISGVYQSSTHNIVPVDSCLIEDEKADAIIVTVRKLLKSFKLRPFDDSTMRGLLRHVLVRRGFASGQIMVVLVTGSGEFPKCGEFVNALLERHPDITTVVRSINDRFTSLVLGDENIVLFGNGYIEDTLCGCRFRISPKAFYQVNPVQTEVLYGRAIEYAGLDGTQTVIDAYCGTGTIGIIAAAHAKKVIGVELNPDAIADARENARLNSVDNIEFFEDDAGRFMTSLAAKGKSADVVIMDPPRAGASLDFLRAVVTLSPETVVYISCNPETLERDLGFLTRKGYKVRRIQPVDMFPWTEHVETVVLLSQQRPNDKIRVELDLRPAL